MSSIEFTKLFEPKLLTTVAVEIFNVSTPSGKLLRNCVVQISNTTSSTRLLNIWAIPDTDSATVTNAIALNKSIPPYDYIYIDIPELQSGDAVHASIDVNANVNIQYASGNLFTP